VKHAQLLLNPGTVRYEFYTVLDWLGGQMYPNGPGLELLGIWEFPDHLTLRSFPKADKQAALWWAVANGTRLAGKSLGDPYGEANQ
jgi:hypothetical protein